MKTRTPDSTAAPLAPENPTLKKLREAAASCRACPLRQSGTQTVFGEGARIDDESRREQNPPFIHDLKKIAAVLAREPEHAGALA